MHIYFLNIVDNLRYFFKKPGSQQSNKFGQLHHENRNKEMKNESRNCCNGLKCWLLLLFCESVAIVLLFSFSLGFLPNNIRLTQWIVGIKSDLGYKAIFTIHSIGHSH